MKIYKTQAEVDKDIVNNTLTIQGDVRFEFHLKMKASLIIEAGNIEAWNIEAWNIEAWNIEARDIKARDIKARDISFYGVCWSYFSFKCKSIVSRRNNSKYFCLDKEVEILPDLPTPVSDATTEAIELLKKNGYKIIKE